MNANHKLNVVLFALTGFGNSVLEALLEVSQVSVSAVFTVRYTNPFPHYEEQPLHALCAERGVACFTDMRVSSDAGIALLRQHSPDLIIVATFKQILAQNVLCLPRLGVVNLHPSLLPRYRGPCPTNAALLNDDEYTGVTAHYVTEKLDEGDILLQRSISIRDVVDDGQLRQVLAKLAGQMVPDLIGMFDGFVKPVGVPQDHRLASHAPRPTVEDGHLELATDIQTICNKVRAFNPLPGTSLLVANARIAVDRAECFQSDNCDGLCDHGDYLELVVNSQAIKLHKRL